MASRGQGVIPNQLQRESIENDRPHAVHQAQCPNANVCASSDAAGWVETQQADNV